VRQEDRIRILVVDDDPAMRDTLDSLLRENGYDVILASGSASVPNSGLKLDLALLDLRLGGESGLSLAQKLQRERLLPVIMLSGVGDDVDRILGLELGADDFIIKPFNPRELLARVRAVLRRTVQRSAPMSVESPIEAVLRFGEFSLDLRARCLMKSGGDEVPLTNSEFRVLGFFASHPNRVFSREELLDSLGADQSRYIDRAIDVLILRLRRKIEVSPSKPTYLQTRRGKGYIFVMDEALDDDGAS